jgi:hypothetical protein
MMLELTAVDSDFDDLLNTVDPPEQQADDILQLEMYANGVPSFLSMLCLSDTKELATRTQIP